MTHTTTMVLWAYYYRPGLTDGASVKAVEAAMKVTEANIASAEAFESESGVEMVGGLCHF